MQQGCGTDHGVDGGAAQLFGCAVGNKDGHEEEGCIRNAAEQGVCSGIGKACIHQRDEQQQHLEHTAGHQAGDHGRHGSGNVVQHCNTCALHGEGLLFLGHIQILVDGCAFLEVKVLHDRLIHGQQILAQNHHQLAAGVDHAQHAGDLFQCFLIRLVQILDHEPQPGHAVCHAGNVLGTAHQLNHFRSRFLCVKCHIVSPLLYL